MVRRLQSEWVDALAPEHPGAIRTRRDLRRINTLMGHRGMLARGIESLARAQRTLRLTEIGAGDGQLLLRVARRLADKWNDVDATLVDLQDLLAGQTKAAFAALGWRVRQVKTDALKWMSVAGGKKNDVIVANLFLHHFSDAQLSHLFSLASKRADALIALEPRRAGWPLFCARSLALIGFSPVTCHDAPISVRAGFTGRELSTLWPQNGAWELTERRAGLFSHLFIARRKG